MGDSDEGNAPKSSSDSIRQQKEALAKAKSVVQRPYVPKSPTSPQVISRAPEVITYPEFAPLQHTPVSPLVTLQRLLLVLYLTAGAAFTSYLVSKLFIQPLRKQVVSSRREFQQHVLLKLTEVTQNISELRSDPEPTTTDDDQVSENNTLSDKLNQLSEAVNAGNNISETAAHNELSFATEDLIAYLNNQIYTSSAFTSYSGYTPPSEDSKNDIINRVKQDIRSVKGAVLNIRNFPLPAVGSTSVR